MGDFTHTTDRDEVVEFIHDVHREGLVSDALSETLINYRLSPTAFASQARVTVPARPSVHPAFAPSRTPVAVVPEPPAPPLPAPAPQMPAPRPPRLPSRAEIWGRIAKKRTKQLWGDFAADFAANALTYLGVLLSVVVVFAFFAFGYFDELIDADHLGFRPLAEIGVVAFFLGLAWVLRHRTGIPQTSAAIEMIGILLIPVVMSASFRDGCTPSYQPWCLPPDVDGPGRWAAYGLVGLISTTIYYWYARRRQVYAYLVGPMLWVAVGSFALYLEDGLSLVASGQAARFSDFTSDGISGAQLITVLLGIGLTIAVASRIRGSKVGEKLSVPLVRSGVAATPFVLVLSYVFSHNDAVARGISAPALADLAWPNFLAATVATGLFVAAKRATFAWEGLGKRTRRDLPTVLEAAALGSLAAAWLFTAGFGVTVAWLGVGLVGYSFVVALTSDGTHPTPVWMVRISALVGAAMSLVDPGPTLVAWGALVGLSMLRAASASVAKKLGAFVPAPKLRIDRLVQMWTLALVATLWGFGRLGWIEATPYLLLVATAAYVASRLVENQDIRSFASVPAAVVGVGALGTQLWTISIGSAPHLYVLSGFLLALAALASMSLISRRPRIAASVVLTISAAMVAMREFVGSSSWETAWSDTTVLGAAGIAMIGVYFAKPKPSTFIGGLGYLTVALAAARSAVFTETLIFGLVMLSAVYCTAAFRLETGRRSVFRSIATRTDVDDVIMRHIPAVVGLVALAPLTALIGAHWNVVSSEFARLGPLLAALSWVYLLAATPQWRTTRRVAVPLAYAAAVTAIVSGIWSETASIVTLASAATVTAAIAVVARRPLATIPSWIFGVGAVVASASRLGVEADDLYIPLHLVALALAAGVTLAAQLRADRRWLVQPAGVAACLLPLTMLAGANVGSAAWVGGSAALAYVALGWVLQIGATSFAVAGSLSVAYGGGLVDLGQPVDEPLLWMPLAIALIASAAALPGRYTYNVVQSPAPGMLFSGLFLGGLSLTAESGGSWFDVALVAMAALLVAAFIVQRHLGWLAGAAASLVGSGLAAGDGWAPLATLGLAIASGYVADRQRTEPAAPELRRLAAVSLGATFALLAAWQQWTTAEILSYASAAGALTLIAAATAEVATSMTSRVRDWRQVALWLSQLAGLAVVLIAAGELARPQAAGVIAAVVGCDAIAAE